MTRAPWNNESRICRWPHDGFSSGPSKGERLRKKYPELQKKWKKYKRLKKIKYADPPATKSLKKRRDIDKKYQKAKDDYEFLRKMLWDY